MKLTATDVLRHMREHVASGGWLGASWPKYVLPRGARVTQSALDWAWEEAVWEGIESQSRRNFEDSAR